MLAITVPGATAAQQPLIPAPDTSVPTQDDTSPVIDHDNLVTAVDLSDFSTEELPFAQTSAGDRQYSALIDETEAQRGPRNRCAACFDLRMFEYCLGNVLKKFPDLKKVIREDPTTMYKQMIAWTVRCGLTGALWTAGYAFGAVRGGADPSTATKSLSAWTGAGLGQALAEMLCVAFIGYYLSDSRQVLKSNSNGAGWSQNLKEGGYWGVSCLVSGTVWQPAVNTFCTSDDLSQFAPACMAKVGTVTGVSFGLTLACIKALLKLADQCCASRRPHFRPFSLENTVADSVLFGVLVCGAADAFFVLTSTDSPFNYRPYSGAEQFEPLPVLTQMGYSALSTMLGGLVAFALRGALSGSCHLYDNWADISAALRQYRRGISLNSQCIIL